MKISACIPCFVHLLILLPFLFQNVCCITDTITSALSLNDNQTIVSAGGSFELGFFSTNTGKRYVGIWYKNTQDHTVVWVANRAVPLNTTTGELKIIQPGILVLQNARNIPLWSTNSSRAVLNPVAQLLDTGNLVVRDANDDNPENFLWQSFDYPTDTFLPEMKLGRNYVTGHEVYLTSSKSLDDPAPGLYTFSLDPAGYPQKTIRMGSDLTYRTGPWNGAGFNGVPGLTENSIISFEVVNNSEEIYFSFKLLSSTLSRFILYPDGTGHRLEWESQSIVWNTYLNVPSDACDAYGLCGANGICNFTNSATCECLEKFQAKNYEDWTKGNWSEGCVRRTPLNCSKGDGFLTSSNLKLPNVENSTFRGNTSLEDCKSLCLENCACTACASLVTSDGNGCLLWFGDLIDMRVSPAGQDIHIRMPSSELGTEGKKGRLLVWVLPLSISIGVLLGLGLVLYNYRRIRKRPKIKPEVVSKRTSGRDYRKEPDKIELPQYEFSRLVQATNDFSPENKLGEGGYGPVYLGLLEEGQEIAVKRLSKFSEQGADQFRNEALCIAQLQHRNLVKLLGCCVEGEEKILIYEYMRNRSLDYWIFDRTRSTELDWPKRFHIIQGIGKGLRYLHEDSQPRVIHRDLKTSNILLDADLKPKISDFGIARIFGGNETEDRTRRVVGTQGYISPEYAGGGTFSIKSDVFSYGVLVLEIISGRRNRSFLHEGYPINLLGYAWMQNRDGKALELVDPKLRNSYCPLEVMRAIKVGLLCVQHNSEDRPEMSSVVNMLGNALTIPEANQPGFFMERVVAHPAFTMITVIEPR